MHDTSLVDLPAELRPHLLAMILVRAQPDPRSKCVNLTGYREPKGYVRIYIMHKGKRLHIRAHRAVWILTHGPIPDPTLVIDHLCGNRSCVNPDHLDLTTNHENLARGDDRRGRPRRVFSPERRTKDACAWGHPWPEFQYVSPSGRIIYCRECNRVRQATARARRRSR